MWLKINNVEALTKLYTLECAEMRSIKAGMVEIIDRVRSGDSVLGDPIAFDFTSIAIMRLGRASKS